MPRKKDEQPVRRIRKPDMRNVRPLLELAVKEDYGKGDPTSMLTVSEKKRGRESLITREEIVVCGMEIIQEVLKMYDPRLTLKVLIPDGHRANVADRLGIIEGPLRAMHSAERVVLNFLQRLCGISTMTWKFVSAIRGTRAKIYDTRKTIPGWRELEKYAVRCGGGYNHRMNLGEMVMFKDNHLADLGERFEVKLRELVQKARQIPTVKSVIVEVDHVDDQLDRVLPIPGIDIILLDNMGQWQLKHAVEMRNKMCGRKPLLEASGGITLNNVLSVASCGVDRIAVGAITHSAVAVDIGLDR
ncbi:MAG TPA: carboxylating nicotinate-nucleotide diphosphorylase [Anaerohalosphaeraceae bacterium]|nr:carboxylating nicotinate-nucleotide diphosphorylase [Anaerohalosphaeraceae bacterium]HOL88921.1 carboxylating nicotinate-nucleotide diphosphorylase [Anaerohalosphaeraceae bacterium]HPP56153.1 carboxylating nicotinate-nucleotide diphosphorylase [Anaerohalosphaeraceae bacterium]